MSFLFRNMQNNQIPNSDVPKGVNLKYANFNKPKDDAKEGYNNQKLNDTVGNKLRSNITKSGKPGAGWEDEEEENSNTFQPNSNENANENNKGKLFNYTKPKNASKPASSVNNNVINNENILYSVETLAQQTIEHEIKIVSEIIQPQGARVKPQDNLLISFGKACEVLKTDIIGSILISNLTTEVAWLILMKTLYAIEYLIKNYPKYFKYFQTHKIFLINLNVPQEENQATHVKNLSNGIISILENQAKTEKPYQHDELLIKNLAKTQESKANDLLDLGVKKEIEDSNKKKINSFDLFNNKPQTSSNQTNFEKPYSNGNKDNLVKTQNLDILNAGENSIKIVEDFTNLNVKDSSYQNSENKKTKFGFINKKPQKSIGTDETTIEESSKKESNKPNKFDPFSLASSKQQEKPMIENENKKKSFGFIKKADNSNELLNINFTDNSNSIYSQPNDMNMIPQQTDNRNNSFLNSQKTNASNNLNLNPQAHYFNVTTQNTNLNQMPINPPLNHQNLNQKFPLDNLYSNYQMPNINPMMMNMYYAQMNSGYMIPNINMMNYPGNMMGGTMLGVNHNMMNPGFGMNMINPLAPVEINNNLEKKEPKKVIDESAFDFIKLE